MVIGQGYTERFLTEVEARNLMTRGLEQVDLADKRVLIIIPDATRSGPVDMFFRLFHDLLGDQVAALDYLIALGTHQPLVGHRHSPASGCDCSGNGRKVS